MKRLVSGGEGGQVAASTLRQIVGCAEPPWRPADANEGFEIVRRRIFPGECWF
ncbi:MAG TPA: hypothetical protein VHD63_24135 [Ktedonobacteraceae bacterium]|nr:hypothetical protein [Ktedonobacteraceae bacterium]